MVNSAKRQRRLEDVYAFPGFRPQPTARGVFGDPIGACHHPCSALKKTIYSPSVNSGSTSARVGAQRFFGNWRASLKWQRLKSYEKLAETIDRYWDGIAAYCRPENKVPLGFVEGLNK